MDSVNIGVVGWHNHRNCGDDAMLAVIAQAVGQHWDTKDVAVIAARRNLPVLPPERPRLLPLIPRGVPRGELVARHRSRRLTRVVFGGGSILHSANSIQWKTDIARTVGQRGGAAGALGVSLGPFPDDEARRMCEKFLQLLDFLVVRDAASMEVALSMNPSYEPRLAHDVAVAFPMPDRDRDHGPRRSLGISLVPGLLTAQLADALVGMVDTLEKTGVIDDVLLLEMCNDPKLGDGNELRSLQGMLPPRLVRFAAYGGGPADVVRRISSCRLVVGARLHSQVLAVAAGVPVVALGYHRKNAAVLEGMVPSALVLTARDVTRETLYRAALEALDLPLAPSSATLRPAVLATLRDAL